MQIRILYLALALLIPAAATTPVPAAAAGPVDEAAVSGHDRLPVAMVLEISREIVGLQREFRAQSFSGKTYQFQVNIGEPLSEAIEATTRSVFHDVYTAPTDGLPRIRFDLADWESNISLKDSPISVHGNVSTRIALRATIFDPSTAQIFSTTVEGRSSISRNVVFGGVSLGSMLVEQSGMEAINQALKQFRSVMAVNRGLDFYGAARAQSRPGLQVYEEQPGQPAPEQRPGLQIYDE